VHPCTRAYAFDVVVRDPAHAAIGTRNAASHAMHTRPLLLLLAAQLTACSSASTGDVANDTGVDTGLDAGLDAAPEASRADAGDPPIDPRYADLATAFDAERVSFGASGAALAIVEHGTLTFAHGFGTKGPNSADAVDARTLFRVGSMTKMLTAAALLQLVAAGKTDLSKPLTSIDPTVAISGNDLPNVTLFDLLSQQTGINDYLAVDDTHVDSALASYLTSATYRSHTYFMNPPGLFWNYSNPNYMLAGLAIETLSGTPYRTRMHDALFAPLGMSRTFFLPSEAIADGDVTHGHSTYPGYTGDVAPDAYDNAWARPCGYAFSSVLDYARFAQLLLNGDASILPDAQRTAMTTRAVNTRTAGDIEGYGFGLLVDDGFFIKTSYFPTPLVWHNGALPGFSAEMYLVPSSGFAFIAFANADDAYFKTSVVTALTSFAQLPAPAATAPSLAPDPTTYAAIAGDYFDATNLGHVTLTADTTGLTIKLPDVDAAGIAYTPALQAVAIDTFALTIQGTQVSLTFLRDASGGYGWMRARQFVAQRAATTTTTTTTASKRIEPERLRSWIRTARVEESFARPW
jgi:CubicO group peptidase (beta-lactamase class C family)